jgi:hypothetical protein
MRTFTWQQVFARRLEQSSLDRRAANEQLLEVAHRVLGAHAQLLTGAELALSARVDGVTREQVAGLLWNERALVKGNTIRGTLHLHSPADYALWKSLPSTRWREPKWLEWQELTLADAERLRSAVLDAIETPQTRVEIGVKVGGKLGRRLAEDSWGHYLAPANDSMCNGPPRGRNVTFVRCDRWIDGWKTRDAAEARRELLHRYLDTYGPARFEEFRHWFGHTASKDDFAELEEVDVEGHRSFVVPGTPFPDAEPKGVRLLSHYDVYVIACHPRDLLIPREKHRIFLKGAGPNPAVLVDGRVAGVWTRTRRGKRMEIAVEPFVRLSGAQRAELAEEAQRVARHFGTTAELV